MLINENGVDVTNQLLNPDTAATIDTAQGQPKGTVTKHAVIESYIGAKENPGSGDAVANPSARNSAHNQANALDANNINTNGSIIQTEFSNNGKYKSRVNIDNTGKRTSILKVKTKNLGEQ